MNKILNKFNFIIGIIAVFIALWPAKILEDIARFLLGILQNIFYYIGGPGVSGGYLDLFYESLVMEFVGTAVYCGSAIFLPIFLFEKLFKKIKINWVPAIALLFLMFLFFGYKIISLSWTSPEDLDFVDTIQFIVMVIGYFAGFISPLVMALKHVGFDHPLMEKFR